MPQSEVPLPPQAPVPDKREIVRLLSNEANQQELFRRADAVRKENVGDEVHLRGLIEFSNICRNNCLYCGIRRGNTHVCRYRMDEAELVETAHKAADMGFKTIVMQSGEDMYYTKDRLCRIIAAIKKFDVAITLSIGERTYAEYKAFREAGADRYLMRIETTNKELYHRLDPQMSWQQRYECLLMIKELGYELGSGIMVGLPGQSIESIAEDLLFLRDLPVDMAGVSVRLFRIRRRRWHMKRAVRLIWHCVRWLLCACCCRTLTFLPRPRWRACIQTGGLWRYRPEPMLLCQT